MWLIICWLLGLRTLVYHLFIALVLITFVVCYKIFSRSLVSSIPAAANYHLQNRYQILLTDDSQQARLRDRIKFIIMRRLKQLDGLNVVCARARRSNHTTTTRSEYQSGEQRAASGAASVSANLSTLSVLLLLALVTCQRPSATFCLEEDAQIMAPVANLAKSMIKTVTLGVPLDVSMDTSGIVKNFAYFTWRTGFPVTMPSGFMQKAQDFYNRVRARVDKAPVEGVERKPLTELRSDLDNIVDGIVEQVRQSPDGLYTDYLQARVGTARLPIEDACTQVGIQLKAYGVDLTNYRSIAGAVLGIPVMPTVASAVINVASMGKSGLDAVQNLTTTIVNPLDATTSLVLSRLPNGQLNPFGGMLFRGGNSAQLVADQ